VAVRSTIDPLARFSPATRHWFTGAFEAPTRPQALGWPAIADGDSTLILSPTGMVLPAKELCAEARKRGIIVVCDGAHAPAFTAVNLAEIDADFYGANCHKWLLAPTGAGFLHLGTGNEDRLQPLQVSWGYRPDRSQLDQPDEFGMTPRARSYLDAAGRLSGPSKFDGLLG
jgi:isopenicillin-N epimerase